MVIGFVGLGIMGKPMAKNLCRAGYTLIVNDHHKENVDELVQAGARSGDLKQIGMESDVISRQFLKASFWQKKPE